MRSRKKRPELEALKKWLASPPGQEFFARMGQGEPFLTRFKGWPDVLACMWGEEMQEPDKDRILAALIQAAQGREREAANTVLLAIFWPGLEMVAFRKRKLDPNREDLWQNIVWTFFQAVGQLDLRQRTARLPAKLANDTYHGVHELYGRLRGQNENTEYAPLEILAELAGTGPWAAFADIDGRESESLISKLLADCVLNKRLDGESASLLMESLARHENMAEYARRTGCTPEAARQRRCRALRRLRAALK